MNSIQQVLFQLESSYYGHPYYVSGHALFNALAPHVDGETRQSLHVSHGMFVPGEYGEYPANHSQDGYAGVLGSSLPAVETYDDLFLYRNPVQRWLLDSRPRDAHNTHDLESHGGREAFAPKCHFGRPPQVRNHKRSVQWYLHCYLHAEHKGRNLLPIADNVLDGLQLGGGRNYGLGEVTVADTQCIDLERLDYSRLDDSRAEGYVLELITPYVLASTYPGADDQPVPWWWAPESTATRVTRGDGLRRREDGLVTDGEVHTLQTVDHGQVVGYGGNMPIGTARNGVLRIGTHSRFGFGEVRVRPASDLPLTDVQTDSDGQASETQSRDRRGGQS